MRKVQSRLYFRYEVFPVCSACSSRGYQKCWHKNDIQTATHLLIYSSNPMQHWILVQLSRCRQDDADKDHQVCNQKWRHHLSPTLHADYGFFGTLFGDQWAQLWIQLICSWSCCSSIVCFTFTFWNIQVFNWLELETVTLVLSQTLILLCTHRKSCFETPDTGVLFV